jgi:drug/metabolite transporter (DMT)-like permease
VSKIRQQTKSMLLVVVCTFLFSIAQFFYKDASNKLSFSIEGILLNYSIWFALFLYGIGTLIFTYALRKGELSILYPVISTSFIWVALFSYILLGEPLTAFKIIGITSIIFGVITLNSYKNKGRRKNGSSTT